MVPVVDGNAEGPNLTNLAQDILKMRSGEDEVGGDVPNIEGSKDKQVSPHIDAFICMHIDVCFCMHISMSAVVACLCISILVVCTACFYGCVLMLVYAYRACLHAYRCLFACISTA
jgi:hypothetical protein